MVSYIVMTILGTALIVYGVKKSKLIMVGGILMAAVGLFLVICTIILASAVRNSEPNPKFEDDIENGLNSSDPVDAGIYEDEINDNDFDDTDENGGYYVDGGGFLGENGGSEGADWRTWRSYSEDYVISDDVTVCLSRFGDGSGFAVYDSSNGNRIGSLVVEDASGGVKTVEAGAEIKQEDIDGDGLKELGIVMPEDNTVWFHYTDGVWTEGGGGGCFKLIK
ncbi:MAG: hypothetical protein K6E85_09345 [Lachnospiraceae bacterium]|nr:hypothetical protein [Lachnospiraceae bacterium]